MGKLAQKWHSTNRKWKVLILLLVTAALFPLIWLVSGAPPLSPEMSMRREEKARFTGPATIIATEQIKAYGFDEMIIGESEYGYTLYGYSRENYASDHHLVYRAKTGNLTVIAMKDRSAIMCSDFDEALPILLFDEYPAAVRAELDITYGMEYNDEYEFEYSLQANRENSGYFLFSLPFNQAQFSLTENGLFSATMSGDAYSENEVIHHIGQTLGGGSLAYHTPVPVTVRLYDKDDNLILERSMDIVPYDLP